MKYLLYYNLDSAFVTDQTNAGGDGKNVVSVVDGVAWTNDQENVYYRYANNDIGNLTSYTVTVHYVDILGNNVASADTISVNTYRNKKGKLFLQPKSIDNYVSVSEPLTLEISGDTEYTFTYTNKQFYTSHLTFEIVSSGTISWGTSNSNFVKSIQYKINDGAWTNITPWVGGNTISVSVGDIVKFKGNNDRYASAHTVTSTSYLDADASFMVAGNSFFCSFGNGTAKFNIYGNIASMLYDDSFANKKLPSTQYLFSNLFRGCGAVNCENLIMDFDYIPALGACYSMFRNCSGLTKAPELMCAKITYSSYEHMFENCTSLVQATTKLPALEIYGYSYSYMFAGCTNLVVAPDILGDWQSGAFAMAYMFSGCTNLNYVKCLLTRSADTTTQNWLKGVASSGTFIKNPNMSSWTTGTSGIPSNWTVQDAS